MRRSLGSSCAGLLLFIVKPFSAEHIPFGHHDGAGSSGFLTPTVSAKLRDELHMAIRNTLGAGHDLGRGRLAALRNELQPMWKSLAKNQHGRVDRRSLRYAIHRHLMKTRKLSIQGLEPTQQAPGSDDVVALLTDHAPAYVRALLEGNNAEKGFSLDDAVAMIAMLEELIAHQSQGRVEMLFRDKGWHEKQGLDRETFVKAVEMYLVRWMMGTDLSTVRLLEESTTLLHESFDNWEELRAFAAGAVDALQHSRLLAANISRQPGGWSPMKKVYTIDDAQAVAGSISLSFGTYWQTECSLVKASLAKMDYDSNGRVKLSDFHGAALEGEWRFSESQDYLRKLGALDESSPASGARVIIANYLQGASNCIISEPQYRICCSNDCEMYLAEIEDVVQSPVATLEQVLGTVQNITISLEDVTPIISDALKDQLQKIADMHKGDIPLHGRLFSQWLHYVFPQDCPFPHKAGTTTSVSPMEYGDDYMASETEIEWNARKSSDVAVESIPPTGDAASEWIAQWSHEEELLTNDLRLNAPWETGFAPSRPFVGAITVVGAVGLCLAVWRTKAMLENGGAKNDDVFAAFALGKTHLV